MKIRLKSWRHVGDTVCLSAAMANLAFIHPDWEIWYSGNYDEMCEGTRYAKRPYEADRVIQLAYNDGGGYEKTASRGNVCEAYTQALAGHLGESIPCATGTPVLPYPSECAVWAEQYKGCILVNSNCQKRSSTKGYPYWNLVCKRLLERGEKVVLMGGSDDRDIEDGNDFSGCIDLRGKTSIRELMALATVSACVVSPASGIVHISAAYDTPCVVVIGAREASGLTDYPFTRRLTNFCLGRKEYGVTRGCMHFQADETMKSCEKAVEIDGRWYPECMSRISPDEVIQNVFEIKRKI